MNNRRLFIFTLFFLSGCLTTQASNEVKQINTVQEWVENDITGDDFVWYCKDNCPWCDRQEPIVELLAEKFPQIRFFKIKSPNLANVAGMKRVRSYPTSFFKTQKWVGFTDLDTLERNITGILERQ